MARSGTTDYSVTRNDIINQAFEDIGVKGAGDTLSSDNLNVGTARLNQMVKRDITAGLHLWGLQQGTVFLNVDQESYQLGVGGDEAASTYINTEVSTAAVTGAGTIDVDSITGISNGDYIGIELDDATLQWTTVNGVPAGSTITLTDVLTDDVSVGAYVYTYTTIIERPVRILGNTIRLQNEDGTEIPVRLTSSSEYMLQVTKSTSGKINQVYYDRTYGATGTLYVWPTADSVQDVLNFTFERTLQDFDSADDNPDYPIEAADYLVKNLALQLCLPYGIPMEDRKWLKLEAMEAKEDWLSFDSEQGSFFLQPERRY